MIVLYAVTGCVSLLFCVIIISGAIRAVRHPERYGPGGTNRNGETQSRARGLTRAILDTFPIVKFGSVREEDDGRHTKTDVEAHHEEKQEEKLPEPGQGTQQVLRRLPRNTEGDVSATNHGENIVAPPDGERVIGSPGDSSQPGPSVDVLARIPAAIGRETCPICIVDFEQGDELRVLPCDGAHRFHQTCVDPWLLELSTACPICRHDFLALEAIISGGSSAQDSDPSRRSSRLSRFSRYLRFARHHGLEQGSNPGLPPNAEL